LRKRFESFRIGNGKEIANAAAFLPANTDAGKKASPDGIEQPVGIRFEQNGDVSKVGYFFDIPHQHS